MLTMLWTVVQGLQSQVSQLEKDKQAAHTQIGALQDKLGATVAELATAKVSADGERRLGAKVQQLKDTVHGRYPKIEYIKCGE